ncbi:MAG: phosphoadenylyl-sulfate reductase [Armatimonadetes bacterium]|nr:phosphoadenylyl-sulfate reductase [Armatimonadota bacterium]
MPEEVTFRQIGEWNVKLAGCEPGEVVAWAVDQFGDGLALACSFSVEDTTLVHLLAAQAVKPRVFALDTGRLPEETYQTAAAVAERYQVGIEWYYPEAVAVEQLLREKGPYSFRLSLENRHECCRIRKVEPLRRALAGRSAWMTGLRRGQSVTRVDTDMVELDPVHGNIVKINPLARWTGEQVRAFAAAEGIPIHPLHDQGYPSIGCAPCTRAVAAGEHERAGRWWWEAPEHKECGLHPRRLSNTA